MWVSIETAVWALLIATLMSLAEPLRASPQTDFLLHCSGCHGQAGAGTPDGGIPDFRGYVSSFMLSPEGQEYNLHVPGVTSAGLSDKEIAEVMNYVMQRWGLPSHLKQAPLFTKEEVANRAQKTISDVVPLRRQVAAQLRSIGAPVANYPWP